MEGVASPLIPVPLALMGEEEEEVEVEEEDEVEFEEEEEGKNALVGGRCGREEEEEEVRAMSVFFVGRGGGGAWRRGEGGAWLHTSIHTHTRTQVYMVCGYGGHTLW